MLGSEAFEDGNTSTVNKLIELYEFWKTMFSRVCEQVPALLQTNYNLGK